VKGVTLCATDVGARKRAEEALLASEARYRSLLEVLPDGIFVSSDDVISFSNPAMAALAGVPGVSDLLNRSPLSLFDASDHGAIRSRTQEMIRTSHAATPAEYTMTGADGSRRRVRVVASPLLNQAKSSFVVVCHDLSDMVRTEGLLRSVLESVTDAILTTDSKGIVQSANPAATRLFGYEMAEILGHAVDRLLGDSQHVLDSEPLSRVSDSNAGGRRDRELVAQRKDGTRFPIDLSVTCFRRDEEPHFTAVVRDITERKRLEDQFRQAHKMEAFGQLAGGVAHDFNNLLTAILGTTELLLSGLSKDDPSLSLLGEIHEAGKRAAALTRQLLAFSRKTVLEPKIIDVNEVVSETQRMLARILGEDVALVTRLSPKLNRVRVDPGQLSQVLLNLAVNARDAMPNGGELMITTANVKRAATPGDEDGASRDEVLVRVRDTGGGMTDEVRAQVYQPFFTTKGIGKSTGLGLAVVHGIVTQSGGRIELDSAPGRGTQFDIYFPSLGKPASSAPIRTPPAKSPAGTETVLVVEDEALVRRVAERVLKKQGYRVLLAEDADSALRVLDEAGHVDVVLTDVVMPGMDGGHLGEIISARFPNTRVIYASGYTEEDLVRRGLQAESIAFLGKPYSPSGLALAVRTAIDR
jgi:PAS domain S-box-containing protein